MQTNGVLAEDGSADMVCSGSRLKNTLAVAGSQRQPPLIFHMHANMSTTHAELQAIVVEPLDLHSFRPIAELRIHMRELGW